MSLIYRWLRRPSFMDIQIEKHVPIPKRTKIPDLPLAEMEIGDSFVAPINASEQTEVRALRQRISRWQRDRLPVRFSVVRDGEQMRVFRIA
ncbi:MAG: hypothetical protein CMB36_04395 [Euryarchaeota archaeon]|nr:hypothetical protein [Euryarchaeota archaeon]|tara:strand:+ start:3164 stop:3436 length:273 start_codon:yes stop_codon:yes gene_type:complete